MHLRKLFGQLTATTTSRTKRTGHRTRLSFQRLEDRLLLTATSGTYDENVTQPNEVDRTAPGSTIDVTEFTTEVADAYANNLGGVMQGTSVGSFVFWGRYGASASKTMYIDMIGNNIGIGNLPNGPANATAISGTGAYSSTGDTGGTGYDFMSFDFRTADDGQPIPGGEDGEEVLAFGLTVLSLTGSDYGTMTVVATQSDGSTLSASQAISENAEEGDTFYGFRAEPGRYIDSFTLSYDGAPSGDRRIRFDDVGFITGVPEDVIAAEIDILPDDDNNIINGKKKAFDVAVLGSTALNVQSIDIETVRFGATGTEDSVQQHKKHGLRIRYDDINGDGLLDLVASVETGRTGLTVDSVDAALTALTSDGLAVSGSDLLTIRVPGKKS